MALRSPYSIRLYRLAAAASLAIGGASLAAGQNESPAPPSNSVQDEAPFLAENDAAMTKMMNDMAVKPTGDVDRDFVAMMAPHHQGAIDMALAVLRYGHNEQIRRLAQEIVVTQQQEIAAMRLAIGDPLPPSAPSPTEPAPAPSRPTPGGAMTMSHDAMKMK
jgi:uncharacterized protein (DUF305 family)